MIFVGFTGTGSIKRKPGDLAEVTMWGSSATTETVGNQSNTYITVNDTGKWVRYLTNATETGVLQKDVTYDVTFKYRLRRSSASMTGTTVPVYFWACGGTTSGSSIAASPANGTNGVYLRYNSADEMVWQTATIKGLKRFDTDGILRLQIPTVSGHSDNGNHMLVDLDDFVFTEVVQTEFTQDFNTGFTTKGQSGQILRDPDGLLATDANCWATAVTEGENTYLTVANDSGKTIPYLTNKAEAGLLRTDDSKYQLTFKYRISIKEGTDTSQPVQVVFVGQDAAIDWSNIGQNGASQKNGVKLYYDATQTSVWRTATIYNLIRNDTNGYLKAYIAAKPDGSTTTMQVDLDDVVITEMSTNKTASVKKTGAGSALLSKTTVSSEKPLPLPPNRPRVRPFTVGMMPPAIRLPVQIRLPIRSNIPAARCLIWLPDSLPVFYRILRAACRSTPRILRVIPTVCMIPTLPEFFAAL